MDPQSLEQVLLGRQLPHLLPPEQDWIVPHYQGLSIANIPATIAALFDHSLPEALPPLPQALWTDWQPGIKRVVLVILDALGYQLLQGRWAAGQGETFSALAQAGRLIPLTSVFPSTTDAALMSLRTGCPPAQHGWLAYTMYLRELGIASNAILLTPMWSFQRDLLVEWGLDPDNMIPVPSLAESLASKDIATSALLASAFRGSAFTKVLYRGVQEIHTHRTASDFWVQLRHLLAETRGQRAVVTAYWSALDTLSHAYGPGTDLAEAEFQTIDLLLKRHFLDTLPAQDREGTLLLITADHGQIQIPPEQIVTAQDTPELSQHLLVPITGESRAAFVHPRPGRAKAIADYLQETFPGWFVVLESARALETGLLGKPIYDESYARAGELLVLPTGAHALQHSQPKASLVGRHGGLSAGEMLVPLIGVRLEATG
jgi:hypothetical protein